MRHLKCPIRDEITLSIGNLPIVIRCRSAQFIAMLQARYVNFIRESGVLSQGPSSSHSPPTDDLSITLEVAIIEPSSDASSDSDLTVTFEDSCWVMRRGDFCARWNPISRYGVVRQGAYPYAIDSVMRIISSLRLAESGGFLLHSASAIRGSRAFLFTGVSGAGKSTIARLAPADVTLLSDEVSCVRRVVSDYHAFGTPFAGELGISGEDITASIAALYFLRKGSPNRIARIDAARAAAKVLRNVLFFADDATLVEQVFDTVCDFATKIPFYELTFEPQREVWDLVD
jgi:hypothetical protein